MIVYRIASEKYKYDISGYGAKLVGGRWNSIDKAMLYTSEHISLCLLEKLAQKQEYAYSPVDFYLLQIQLPKVEIKTIDPLKLKKNWSLDISFSRFIGDHFLQNSSHLVLKVPSAVVPEEHNLLINPLHSDFKKIIIKQCSIYKLDERLFAP
jgi:RES domain-containing protein